jgi:hypothetical protein
VCVAQNGKSTREGRSIYKSIFAVLKAFEYLFYAETGFYESKSEDGKSWNKHPF